jgi:hypothetical protein
MENNTATNNRGGCVSGNEVTVTSSTFVDNDTNEEGGCIAADQVSVTGSLFRGNDADTGGAIFADSSFR